MGLVNSEDRCNPGQQPVICYLPIFTGVCHDGAYNAEAQRAAERD